ncbi:hypothetical protein RFI_05235 [Reticulomyxa filosa]|uniref:Uncharacterized protein n=1 Tax=Reticulomyxa filosa TaxID=46433 RepID=X6P1F0_RETFI|nr:hypothetical protein RFI_05235 [Reticulomyxa filosa]|eukprot:ETO31884.1 hypothetical protein RFI_05235 [Reticulomyxa filosa]
MEIMRIELNFNLSFVNCMFVNYLFLDTTTHTTGVNMSINHLHLDNVYTNLSYRYKSVETKMEYQSRTGVCFNALFVISDYVEALELKDWTLQNIQESAEAVSKNMSMFLNTPLLSINPYTGSDPTENSREIRMTSAFVYNCSLQSWLTQVICNGAINMDYCHSTRMHMQDCVFALNTNMDPFTTTRSVHRCTFVQNSIILDDGFATNVMLTVDRCEIGQSILDGSIFVIGRPHLMDIYAVTSVVVKNTRFLDEFMVFWWQDSNSFDETSTNSCAKKKTKRFQMNVTFQNVSFEHDQTWSNIMSSTPMIYLSTSNALTNTIVLNLTGIEMNGCLMRNPWLQMSVPFAVVLVQNWYIADSEWEGDLIQLYNPAQLLLNNLTVRRSNINDNRGVRFIRLSSQDLVETKVQFSNVS